MIEALFTEQIRVQEPSGARRSDGGANWGSAVTYAAHVEEEQHTVVTIEGDEGVASHKVSTYADVSNGARIWVTGQTFDEAETAMRVMARGQSVFPMTTQKVYELSLGRGR